MAKQRSALGQIVDFDLLRVQHDIANQKPKTVIPAPIATSDLSGLTAAKLGMGLRSLAPAPQVTESIDVGNSVVEEPSLAKRKITKPAGY
jgi:hypothetical protein